MHDYQTLHNLALSSLNKREYSLAIDYSGKMISINACLIDGYSILLSAFSSLNLKSEAKGVLKLATKYCKASDLVQIQDKLDSVITSLCTLPKELFPYIKRFLPKDKILDLARTSSFCYKNMEVFLDSNPKLMQNDTIMILSLPTISTKNNNEKKLELIYENITKIVITGIVITGHVFPKKILKDMLPGDKEFIIQHCSRAIKTEILEFHLMKKLNISLFFQIISLFKHLKILKLHHCTFLDLKSHSSLHLQSDQNQMIKFKESIPLNLFHLEILQSLKLKDSNSNSNSNSNLVPICLCFKDSKLKNFIVEGLEFKTILPIKLIPENMLMKSVRIPDLNHRIPFPKTLVYDISSRDQDLFDGEHQLVYENHLNRNFHYNSRNNLKALMIRNAYGPQGQFIEEVNDFNCLEMLILEKTAINHINAPNLKVICFSRTCPSWEWLQWMTNREHCPLLCEIYIINQMYGIEKRFINILLEWYLRRDYDNDKNDDKENENENHLNSNLDFNNSISNKNRKSSRKVLAPTSPINFLSYTSRNRLKKDTPRNLFILDESKAYRMIQERWSFLGNLKDCKFLFNYDEN